MTERDNDREGRCSLDIAQIDYIYKWLLHLQLPFLLENHCKYYQISLCLRS